MVGNSKFNDDKCSCNIENYANKEITNPKFSIILPVFNVEKYITECFNSILNQTLQDFEVICINDSSTDNSLQILNDFANKDKRFIVITQENQGQGVARNNALKIANGEYIVFVDPDDLIEPNMLEDLYKTFKATNTNVIEFNYKTYNESSKAEKIYSLTNHLKKVHKFKIKKDEFYNIKDLKKNLLHKIRFYPWTRAYSNSFIKETSASFSPTKRGEDQLFAFIILFNAEKIQYLDKVLYTYRIRKGSAINSVSDKSLGVFKNSELLKDYMINHNFYNEYEKSFKEYKIHILSHNYNFINNENKEKYTSLCKEILSDKEYKAMIKATKRHYNLLEKIFSIKNENHLGTKYKVIRILGIKITIKTK